jgi:hypothetical protein
MTTTIFTNLLGPICELYYKYNRDLDLYQANINTIRNFGQSTNFSINFGFEMFQPFDLNNIKLQPGVYTTNSIFIYQPYLLNNNNSTNAVQNLIYLQELPSVGYGIVTYINKTLPIIIGLQSNISGQIGVNGVIGIASNYVTNGVPYDFSNNNNYSITRQFESDYVINKNYSILVFVNMENTTFVGTQTNWTALQTSLYTIDIESYRYNNGFGQFFSQLANSAFIQSNTSVDTTTINNLYISTYNFVYNWINNLTWTPDFVTWIGINSSMVPYFLNKFLNDHFNLP